MSDLEERIRQRAYELWEAAGCPDGRSQEFWQQAQEAIEIEMLDEQDQVIEDARVKRDGAP